MKMLMNVADMDYVLELECNANEPKHRLQIDEIDHQAQDDEQSQQLERLWRTDFENSEVETRVCASLEDKRALEIMERRVKCNMYVDDMMKSTNTTEKAVLLVGQLQELLPRGGFHLTN